MSMDDKDDARERIHNATEDAAHSASADKAKGRVKEAVGKVKEKVGGAIGDHELEAKGTAQRVEGKKDRLKGEIKDKIDDVKEHIEAGVEVVKDKIDEARGKK
ncbi:MAG: CsbD family protein [Nevskia sp.]|nr:CsbD family protein [Nevskia sp.]